MLVELCFGTLLFLICFFWGFTALNGVVFQVVTSNQQNIKKSFTKSGSALLTMAIAGGAVVPTLFGALKDSFGAQNAYWLAVPCFLFIFYYGLAGHKIRK